MCIKYLLLADAPKRYMAHVCSVKLTQRHDPPSKAHPTKTPSPHLPLTLSHRFCLAIPPNCASSQPLTIHSTSRSYPLKQITSFLPITRVSEVAYPPLLSYSLAQPRSPPFRLLRHSPYTPTNKQPTLLALSTSYATPPQYLNKRTISPPEVSPSLCVTKPSSHFQTRNHLHTSSSTSCQG